jgi:hypothetical protein
MASPLCAFSCAVQEDYFWKMTWNNGDTHMAKSLQYVQPNVFVTDSIQQTTWHSEDIYAVLCQYAASYAFSNDLNW